MRALNYIGKALISMGVGVLIFVAWTLWGTGIYTQGQQEALARQFARLPAVETQAAPDPGSDLIEVPDDFTPGPGDPVFSIRIPKIDVSHTVVEGVGTEQLRRGPGHYPECRRGFERPFCTELPEVWPGEAGRVIISGHRTTYGAPFFDIDKLRAGDEIDVRTRWGRFTYVVTGREIVPPDSRDIANPATDGSAEMVFTTCHPKFSAAQRLIVYAELEEVSTA